jgi:hypothetical protein
MRYSLRRALSLDSVDGGTHNPTVGIVRPRCLPAHLRPFGVECQLLLHFLLEMFLLFVSPFHENLPSILLDPACGTGGFLTCDIRHMRDRYVKKVADEHHMQEGLRKRPTVAVWTKV